jgi:hypothetical protein
MMQKYVEMRERACADAVAASRTAVERWNRPCSHRLTLERIRNEFCRLTASANWQHITPSNVVLMKTMCRCCLRLLPDWPPLVSQAIEACFGFPDEKVRGLLWRLVLFIIQMEDYLDQTMTNSIKQQVAQHLAVVGHEFCDVIVDGFLGAIESAGYASEVALAVELALEEIRARGKHWA